MRARHRNGKEKIKLVDLHFVYFDLHLDRKGIPYCPFKGASLLLLQLLNMCLVTNSARSVPQPHLRMLSGRKKMIFWNTQQLFKRRIFKCFWQECWWEIPRRISLKASDFLPDSRRDCLAVLAFLVIAASSVLSVWHIIHLSGNGNQVRREESSRVARKETDKSTLMFPP